MKTSVRDLSIDLDVWRENVQLFWDLSDTTVLVKDLEDLTVEEVSSIRNAVNICRTFT